ncbi:MAG: PfkB family carbohydrate kinase [Ruthenibacterium sp.]
MFRIIGIGDNVVDRYLYKNKMYPGGNAVNVPVLAVRTGMAEGAYIGCLGSDAAGRHVLAALINEKLDVSHVRVLDGPNAYANVTLVEGDRTFIGGSAGVSCNIKLSKDDEAFVAGYDLIHTSVYSGIDDILPQMKAIGPKIAYDYSDHLNLQDAECTFPYVDFAIFSGGDRAESELQELMQNVVKKGPKQVLVTMGSRGSMLYCGGTFYKQGIFRIEKVVDTMGAGDSFIARYLAGVFAGEETQTSMQHAAEYAAHNCLVDGTFGYEAEIN